MVLDLYQISRSPTPFQQIVGFQARAKLFTHRTMAGTQPAVSPRRSPPISQAHATLLARCERRIAGIFVSKILASGLSTVHGRTGGKKQIAHGGGGGGGVRNTAIFVWPGQGINQGPGKEDWLRL